MSKCDELIEKLKQVHDDYRHRFIPINLDIKVEDLLGAFAEKDAEIAQWKEKFHDLDNQWNEQCKEIAELKAENEKLKAGYVWQEYDAGEDCWEDKHKGKWVQNPELQATLRALWLMTAEWAGAMGLASCNIANKFMSREKFEVGDDYREKTIKKYRHRQVVFYKYADYCKYKAENPQKRYERNKKPLQRNVIRGERLDEDCKRAKTTIEFGKCLCYGLLDNADNTLDMCKKCKAFVWNDEDVNGTKKKAKE